MKSRSADPRHLDVRACAREGQQMAGTWPLSVFDRLQDQVVAQSHDTLVTWSAQGYEIRQAGGAAQPWLHLRASATLQLRCQRCLGLLPHDLQFDRRFVFAPDERSAERLDEEIEDEVLVLGRELDLQVLVEDELLLALPLVPRHDQCEMPLPPESPEAETPDARPFDALAALRRRPGDEG